PTETMSARHVLPLIVVLVAFAFVQCGHRDVAVSEHSSDGQSGEQQLGAQQIDIDWPQAPGDAHFDVQDPPRTIEELRARLQRILERERIAGMSIALVDRNGTMWVGGLGVRDRATRERVDADTAFRVGSLSKSIIALGVMRLVDQGKLDVDRPLREIIPDLEIDNPWEDTAPITLAQCLEHTAGFDDLRFNEIFAPDETTTVRQALALNPRSRVIRWKPGTRHAYSNVGFTVAALAIEKAAGEPFDVYLRREILAPMGIVDADFRRTETIAPRLATGYMSFDEPVVFRAVAHRPPGALLASASDVAKLVHFWIVRGVGYPPIISAAGLARIERSGTLPYPHTDAEYGFANYTDVWSPVIGRGHDGGMPGFHASYRYFPGLDVGYVMLLNSSYVFRGYFEIRALLFSYLTQGRTFPPPAATANAAEPPGAPYFALGTKNGLFGFMDTLWIGFHVSAMPDGTLVVRSLQGDTGLLVPAADGGYLHPGAAGSSVRFTTNADGTPIMLLGWQYTEARPMWLGVGRYAALRTTTALLVLAPLWALTELLLAFIFRRRILPASLLIWPSIAGASSFAISHLLGAAFFAGVIGVVHPLTVGLCAATIVLAVASAATLVCAVRWLRRPDRPPLIAMILPLLFGLAFSGFSLWLAIHGVIGIRTWSW
ncbi:MAG TPA: serine hydrolase domain-containing protein, partial [Kofleriaceae bacterium]|nr:serine hydrolase domain-containing protein [Kofleriaceae bacterium]